MSMRVDVISIGTLERNRLWNETTPVRTAHATTSLIRGSTTRAGKRSTATAIKNLLVDPGLPGHILEARLRERTGLDTDAIDAIFLTNFTVAHRGGLDIFDHAVIYMWEVEIETARQATQDLLERAGDDDEIRVAVEQSLALLDRIRPAQDKLDEGIDLFPLAGHTPGTAGLLVTTPTTSTLIAGDGVPTLDHFLAGQVLPDAHNIQQAQESLAEAYEIADIIIPGHDNLFINPRTQGVS